MTFFYIIVPVFNVENYLEKCLESLVNQKYCNYKIICINDGSTDNSGSILEKYKRNYKNKIIIINQKNSGLSSARNTGLDFIVDKSNCYITFVDSDDWVALDYLKIANTIISKFGCDLIHLPYFEVKKDGTRIVNNNLSGYIDRQAAVHEILLDNLHHTTWSKFYNGLLFEKIRFPHGISPAEDLYISLYIHLFFKDIIIYAGEKGGYYYNKTNISSITNSFHSFNKIISPLLVYQKLYTMIDKENKTLFLTNFAKIFWHALFSFDYKLMTNNEKIILNQYIDWFCENKIYRYMKFKFYISYLLYFHNYFKKKLLVNK